MIISAYPRSGSSWIARVISDSTNAYLTNEDRLFNNYLSRKKIKKIVTFAKSYYYWKKSNHFDIAFITKGHFPDFKIMKNSYWNLDSRFLFIYRDPRDVMISYFFFINSRKNKRKFQEIPKSELVDFINSTASSWRSYMDSWMESPCSKIAYENFLKDPLTETKKVLSELRVEYKEEYIIQAINKWSVSSFRKLKGDEKLPEEQRMVRKANSGDWKNYFDDTIKIKFKEQLNDYLIYFQYETDNKW